MTIKEIEELCRPIAKLLGWSKKLTILAIKMQLDHPNVQSWDFYRALVNEARIGKLTKIINKHLSQLPEEKVDLIVLIRQMVGATA